VGGEHLLGPRGARLLRSLKASGSISSAARGAGMSYKSAWSYLSDMSRLVGSPLVVSQRGGARGGGGSRLTPTGEELLQTYDKLRKGLDKAMGSG